MGYCNMCNGFVDPIDLECGHTICRECLKEYIKAGIKHGIGFFDCPISGNCQIISDRILNSRSYITGPLMCPNCLIVCKQDCDDEYFTFYCESCETIFCIFCREEKDSWYTDCDCRDKNDIDYDIIYNFHDIKKCPVCKILIFREEGCNSMRCTYCKVKFCWECCKTKSKIDKEGHDCSFSGDFIQTYSDDEYVDGYDDGDRINHHT